MYLKIAQTFEFNLENLLNLKFIWNLIKTHLIFKSLKLTAFYSNHKKAKKEHYKCSIYDHTLTQTQNKNRSNKINWISCYEVLIISMHKFYDQLKKNIISNFVSSIKVMWIFMRLVKKKRNFIKLNNESKCYIICKIYTWIQSFDYF